MGGGCPSFMLPFIIARGFLPSCLHPLQSSIFRQSGQIFSKKGQKLDFICSLWCFLGKIGDRKGRNTNIFLKSRKGNRCGGGRLPAFHRVHLWQVVVSIGCRWSGFRARPLLWWCVPSLCPAFCPLCCLMLVVSLANMALFRILRAFLARFGAFVWVCGGLGFCVACGAFVCVNS